MSTAPPFVYQKPFPQGADTTEYRLLTNEFVSTIEFEGRTLLKVEPSALTYLARTAMREIAFKLRTSHLEQVSAILEDPEATDMRRNWPASACVLCNLCSSTFALSVI